LKESSVIIFATTTVLNIKSELKAQQKISILPGQNVKFDDLRINFQDKKPIEFGKNSFFNFKLLAPKAEVHVGEATTLRGQILAKKIKIEKVSVLGKEEFLVKDGDSEKIVEDQGLKFIVNEIIILFAEEATSIDVQNTVFPFGGSIIGIIPQPKIYKIEVQTTTVSELNNIIFQLRNSGNPLIIAVTQNFVE